MTAVIACKAVIYCVILAAVACSSRNASWFAFVVFLIAWSWALAAWRARIAEYLSAELGGGMKLASEVSFRGEEVTHGDEGVLAFLGSANADFQVDQEDVGIVEM
jgi:hypothetical protein